MKIITGYLAREVLKTSLATILVLFIILMSNALGRVLADISDGEIPQQALLPVMLSQSINMLSILLPIGVFLGIMFAFGRMYKDHEIVVMHACGVGYRDFYKAVALVVIPMLVLSVYASLSLNAQMQRQAKAIIDAVSDVNEFQQIRAGQFNQSEDGSHVFFTESISEDKLGLDGIIISEAKQGSMVLETAKSGSNSIDEKTGDLFLVVGPGQRYEGVAGKNNFKIIDFAQHGILIETKNTVSKPVRSDQEKSFAELVASDRLYDKIELNWRIAIPVVLLTLAILAVPLSYIAPRQGRYGKVGFALLAYIVYLNLIALTRGQLESALISIELNFWWVHALFLVIALVLLYRRNRGFWPSPRARTA